MGRTNGSRIKSKKIGYNLTKKQLKKWGVKYHQLIMGKPSYDLIVDDLAIYFKNMCIKKLINIYNYGSTYSII